MPELTDEVFFQEGHTNREKDLYDRALAVCNKCPVVKECLMAHIDDAFGVVGGTTPPEREKMRREKKEAEIEKLFNTLAKDKGGLSYKFTSPGHAGVPDRIAILPDGQVWFVELKVAKGGSVSKLQQKTIERMQAQNANVVVLRGETQVKSFWEDK
jgi:hypothetical protein